MNTDRHSFKSDQTDALSLSVYNVGYEKCQGLHSWGSGVRDHYLIHHIISGKGVYYWAGFNGSDAEFILDRAGFTRECPVISADFGSELKDSLERIYRLSGNRSSDLVKMTGQLYITLGILMERSGSQNRSGSTAKGYVTKAKNYIAHNYTLGIGVD